ncbi:YqzK family protein [Heyndrickxia acidiproducens]|uniref:YqzK family protein n=1 Tax=Heyndrickxia acidiproducens TaxID=1121084 RepID=UPI0003742969|nr:YqzK family protein [Heyndrickxia acidiproducens]
MPWFKMMLHALKIFILFSGFTLLFYFAIMWVNQEYESYHRYQKPKGAAVKVSAESPEQPAWVQRLLLFYLDGE